MIMMKMRMVVMILVHCQSECGWWFEDNSLSGTFPAPSARLGVFESPDSSASLVADDEDLEEDEEEEEARS